MYRHVGMILPVSPPPQYDMRTHVRTSTSNARRANYTDTLTLTSTHITCRLQTPSSIIPTFVRYLCTCSLGRLLEGFGNSSSPHPLAHGPTSLCTNIENQKCHQFLGIIQYSNQVTQRRPPPQCTKRTSKTITPKRPSGTRTTTRKHHQDQDPFRKRAPTNILSLRPRKKRNTYLLQEVLARTSPACRDCTPVVGHGAENLEVWL
jgi:hypothetical protein